MHVFTTILNDTYMYATNLHSKVNYPHVCIVNYYTLIYMYCLYVFVSSICHIWCFALFRAHVLGGGDRFLSYLVFV